MKKKKKKQQPHSQLFLMQNVGNFYVFGTSEFCFNSLEQKIPKIV